MMLSMRTVSIAALAALTSLSAAHAAGKPLKVFILVGQSNMQGQAKLSSFAGMAMDPTTKPLYDRIMDGNGTPRVQDTIYIAAFSQARNTEGMKVDVEKSGKLTMGYGGDTTSPDVAGLELGFGVTMYDTLKEPILLIKTSWGGKSLMVEFRPPSAKPYYEHPEEVKNRTTGKGQVITAEETLAAPGKYYRLMLQHVRKVLADPGTYCPAYDPKAGYEIAGFAWFQGYNDFVSKDYLMNPAMNPSGTGKSPKDYSEYTRLMGCFIRDVRNDLSAPKMPFVIGVFGMDGNTTTSPNILGFRKAQAATADLPEFKGNVMAVHTADCWDEKLGELEGRKSVLKVPDGKQKNTVDKYAALRAKIAPLQKELDALSEQKGKGGSKKKTEELQKKMQDTIYTPEEQDYIAKNRSNQGYHYLGSAKTYSRIGEACAKAILQMRETKK